MTSLAAQAQATSDSFFEFGTVVSMGKRDLAVQSFDPQRQRMVQRSYTLTRDTRADVVHVGDTVEVIYAAGGMGDSGEWLLQRLVAIHGTVPKAGPAGNPAIAAATAPPVTYGTYTPNPAPPPPASPSASAPVATVPTKKSVTPAKSARGAPPATVPSRNSNASAGLAKPSTGTAAAGGTRSVALGGPAPKAVPGVESVGLGVGSESALRTPKVKNVTQEAPGQECNREADWASQPISLAVMDFRYPTDREEANDISKTGGGSGTAVADLVYNRLGSEDAELALRRGDREKLYRMDFAGAARLGRQLGVDAVLLGTFAPVDVVSPDPDFPTPTQAYTLRAGVVETCTGQLLYKLSSITCAAGPDGKPPTSCPGAQVSVKDTVDPSANEASFRGPIDSMLSPLAHNGFPAGQTGSAGVVTAAGASGVTIRLRNGGVKPGDQVSIHAFRLAKNPSTNTLQRFEDTEIGRLTIQRVNGGSATGTFQGDVAPRPGDTAEIITE